MDWTEPAIILSLRKYGEGSAIVDLFTETHGRHRAMVRGAFGSRLRGVLQPGNEVIAHWRARLADHLGNAAIEPVTAHAAAVLADQGRLLGLTSLCALAAIALPEREPHPASFAAARAVIGALAGPGLTDHDWAALIVRWELGLLQDLGFGLDLSKCAATGMAEDLAFVSPKTGRAVSRDAGRPYADKLFALPPFLLGSQNMPATRAEILAGFALTGFFLDRYVLQPHGASLPPARGRLLDWIAKSL